VNEDPDSPAELRARALRLLARREHSRAELARTLAPRAESPEALDLLLKDLEGRKQLSDERYAAERTRVLARKFGTARIRQDLKAKGIAPELIDGVSTEGELDRARAILERKYRTTAATREERAKRMRFLQSRGFSSEIIFRLLSSREAD
jgi:regulatory protein